MNDPALTEGSSEQSTVLVIADDAEFARAITTRWQAEKTVPAFTLMTGDLCPGISASGFELAVVGAVRPGVLPSVLTILESTGRPVIYIAQNGQMAATVRETHSRTLIVRQHEDWLDALIPVASETLRCARALAKARAAEDLLAESQGHATLGRYVLDMRHTLNNALTSILGNSELLLSEPGLLSAHSREQAETVRKMALRMHEIFQRFSSLEMELRYVEKQGASEPRPLARSAVACS
jgi:signal transduction histidine kinase